MGSEIRSKPSTPEYRDNFKNTFGDQPFPKGGKKIYSQDGKEIKKDECPWRIN